jgi:hypothetical protein
LEGAWSRVRRTGRFSFFIISVEGKVLKDYLYMIMTFRLPRFMAIPSMCHRAVNFLQRK